MCILTHEGDQQSNVGLISILPKLNIFGSMITLKKTCPNTKSIRTLNNYRDIGIMVSQSVSPKSKCYYGLRDV